MLPLLERIPPIRGGIGRPWRRGSGLGRQRWPVEQTSALLHRCRRLAVCYERTHEIHDAFVGLACCMICWLRLASATR
jgi:transposase